MIVFEASRPGGSPVLVAAPREEIMPSREPGGLRRASDSTFSLPERIGEKVAAALHPTGGEPVWLELDPVNPHLPLIPWEQLLRNHLNVPLLRLASHSLPHSTLSVAADIVLCTSVPHAKGRFDAPELLDRIIERISGALSARLDFHVFTDASEFPKVQQRLLHWNEGELFGRVRVYPPWGAAPFGVAARDSQLADAADRIESPWLSWILDALRGRSVDVVHFLCHGFWALDQGAIALAQSPLVNEDPRSARFVGAGQLTAFLGRLGALAVAFGSPPDNYSPAGLRLLVHQIANARPGPVLMHQTPDDGGTALHAAYHYLFGDRHARPPTSTAICLYADPTIASTRSRNSYEAFGKRGGRTGFGPELPSAVTRAFPEEPGWITASRRYLDQTVSELIEAPQDSERQRDAYEGIRDALDQVSRIVERHASAQEEPA